MVSVPGDLGKLKLLPAVRSKFLYVKVRGTLIIVLSSPKLLFSEVTSIVCLRVEKYWLVITISLPK